MTKTMQMGSELPATTQQQARHLLRLGLALFLLALLVGVLVPRFSVPRLALSVHLLGVLQGTFLVAVSAVWSKLNFSRTTSWLAFWLLAYGCVAAWLATLFGAYWGAGNTLLPVAAGSAHGSALQEWVIVVLLRSSAVALVVALVLALRTSLRTSAAE
jgi:hydroxylaminobenzene mutase